MNADRKRVTGSPKPPVRRVRIVHDNFQEALAFIDLMRSELQRARLAPDLVRRAEAFVGEWMGED